MEKDFVLGTLVNELHFLKFINQTIREGLKKTGGQGWNVRQTK